MSVQTGLDLTQIATAMGAFFRQKAPQIAQKLRDEDDFRKYCTPVYGVKDQYVVSEMYAKGDVIQPYQDGFTPKGEVGFKPEILQIRQVKADFQITPKALEQTYYAWLKTNNSSFQKYPFIEEVINVLLKRIIVDLNNTAINGSYVPATIGTPGTTLGTFDGLLKIYNDAVTAGKIVPYALGTITADNVVDKLEAMYDMLPSDMKQQGMQMIMRPETRMKYMRKRRGSDFQNSLETNPFIDGTNVQMVTPQYWNSDKIIIVHKANLLYLEDGIDEELNVKFQEFDRILKCLIDFKRGIGFGIVEGQVFGN